MTHKQAIITTLTSQGYGYAIGGVGPSAANEQYDDVANTWASKANLNTARYGLAGFSLNRYGYAIGGVTTSITKITEKYDDVANSWITKADLNTARYYLAGFSLNGYGYTTGGVGPSAATEKYDDVANTWTAKANLNRASAYSACFSLKGYGYTAGGSISSGASFYAEKYDDVANTWTTIHNLLQQTWGQSGFSLNEYGYIAAGYVSGNYSKSTGQYDDVANTWASKANLNSARYYLTGFSLNGYGYTAGGTALSIVEKYDDILNTWTTKTNMATARNGLAGFSIEAPITGNLSISSTPSGARIYIDNIDQGIYTPNTISNLNPGNHDVKLTLTNYNDYTTIATIVSGQTITITPTPTLTLSPGMTRVQASPSFVQSSFTGEIIDIGTLKIDWIGTGTIILEKTIVYDRLVLTGPNGTFDHTWTPCGSIVPEGPFDITNIFSQGYNETNVKIYNVCGGNIGTETGSIDITGPITLTCPIAPKYSGDTITLQATPTGGIGPYYVEFSKDGDLADPVRLGGLNPISNVPENTIITRIYVLTDEDVRNALTGTITFSVFISDSCHTTAQTCTQECIVEIGCMPPVCNFAVV